MHYSNQIEGKRDSSLPVRDRSSFSFFFFNATSSHRAKLLSRSATFFFLTPPRGTERHRSLGPRPILFFFNATPTTLSRSAIACVASASVQFSKERGTRVKHRARKCASKRAGRGHPVAQSDTALSERNRCFSQCHRVAQRRHSHKPSTKTLSRLFSLITTI